MKQNLEIEYKTLLTFEEYQHLLNTFFRDAKAHQQINQYYDTKDLNLLKQHQMARIRYIGRVQEFTLKVPKSEHAITEHSFTQEHIDIDDERVKNLLNDFGIHDALEKVSQSDTLRHVIEMDFGEFALDQTQFDSTIDYECELEVFDENFDGQNYFLDFLERYHITYKPSKPKFLRSLIDFKVIESQPDNL